MTSIREACVVVVAIAGAVLATGAAEAKTCSDRLGACQRFRDKSRPGSCQSKCGEYFQQGVATGCWESKIVARERGFARQ